jgi:hypothetical protein
MKNNRPMKHEEQLAERYLRSIGFSNPIYEPLGNMPPDFAVEERIAVEVRRLNQGGLETLQLALLSAINEVLRSLGPPKRGKSWLVRYRFNRPLPAVSQMKSEILRTLAAFDDDQSGNPELFISDNFEIDLSPSGEPLPYRFALRAYSDSDTTCWPAYELQKNIQICIDEKTAKIAKVRAKYREWWLILVDQIGYGERESISITHNWDKVIVIDPSNPTSGYEL